MFKNITLYLARRANAPMASHDEAQKLAFTPCEASQARSVGFVPPRPHGDLLVEQVGRQLLLRIAIETRTVPGKQLRQRVDELAEQIEKQTGRKPGKKQRGELRERAEHELIPMVFPDRVDVNVWLSPTSAMLVIDTASQRTADDVVTMLVAAFPGFEVSQLNTNLSPQVGMAHWLGTGEAPYRFTVDRECELKSTDEMKAVVRYSRHPLDTQEVRHHITSGKVPTKLALTWADRVSFVLTESLQLRKVAFLDAVFESTANRDTAADSFDADAAILTGEFLELFPDLINALDGLMVLNAEKAPLAQPAVEDAEVAPWA